MLGALFLLAMVAAHGVGRHVGGIGAGPIVEPFPWLVGCRFPSVSREFFDLVSILGLGFLFMASWELLHRPWVRAALLVAACAAAAESWRTALGGGGVFSRSGLPGLGGGMTGQERLLVTVALVLLGIVLVAALPGLSRQRVDRARLRWAWRRACWRWGAGLLTFWAVLGVALNHPYYQEAFFTNWRVMCALLFSVYLFGGLPYAVITCYQRTGMVDDTRDPGFMLLLVFRCAGRLLRRPRTWPRLRRAVWNRRAGLVARDLMVKLFFVPVMTSFFFGNYGDLLRSLPLSPPPGTFGQQPVTSATVSPRSWYQLIFHSFMLMDVALGLIGYLCASRWLGNKSVSVEPTGLGWAVALACYPPFNSISGQLLPYQWTPAGSRPLLDAVGPGGLSLVLDDTLRVVALFGYAIYVFATMAFGLRFSNLTHRGVIERGPYAWIRHPAYVGKNLAWWAENIRMFASPWQFLFMMGWNVIYLLRALTEERHLMRDPQYRAYCERVRYRFVPGLF